VLVLVLVLLLLLVDLLLPLTPDRRRPVRRDWRG